ncbi:MAG: secretin N-terminal domain-containing protein [bacterium]
MLKDDHKKNRPYQWITVLFLSLLFAFSFFVKVQRALATPEENPTDNNSNSSPFPAPPEAWKGPDIGPSGNGHNPLNPNGGMGPAPMMGPGATPDTGMNLSSGQPPNPIALPEKAKFTTEPEVDDSAQAPFLEEDIPIEDGKITLDFKGIDIIQVLHLLSLKTDQTIVPTQGVTGRISICLNKTTPQDALDIIIKSQNLALDKKGNIVYVMTANEYQALYGKKYTDNREMALIRLKYAKPSTLATILEQLRSDIGKITVDESTGTLIITDTPESIQLLEDMIKELDRPLNTAFIQLHNTTAKDIKGNLEAAITKGIGQLQIDERVNRVIISDLPDRIAEIKLLIKRLDTPSKEVFIEAQICQVSLRDEHQRGINWERLSGELALKGSFPISIPLQNSVKTSGLEMNLGIMERDKYNIIFNFLDSYGKTEVISRPRIMVLDNNEAKIMIGAREAYITQSLSQAETSTITSESVQFIDVGVKLNITPTINADNFITLKIKPEVSSVRESIQTALGSVVPIVETAEAETIIKIKDGATVILGGLIKEEKRKGSLGIPLLSSLPGLGLLFQSKARGLQKSELIILITPHITDGGDTSKLDQEWRGRKGEEKIEDKKTGSQEDKKKEGEEKIEEEEWMKKSMKRR